MTTGTFTKVFLLVQIAAFSVFLGRAWQHFFWDAPFRTLLWDEQLMSGWVASFLDMPWEEYVSSPKVDRWIQNIIKGTGIFYLFCAFAALLVRHFSKITRIFLFAGVASLTLLAAAYMKVSFYSVGQFFEYTLQFTAPIFLAMLILKRNLGASLIFWMKVAAALTFVCHGLYAIGYYPRPGQFVQMVISILQVSEKNAVFFLQVVGLLDFLAAMLIFLPRRFVFVGLSYMIIWGFATTIARIWANFYPEFWLDSLHQWTNEAMYRMPHFLIPLAIFMADGFGRKFTFLSSN